MNRSLDLALVLQEFLADDGLTAPDYVLDVVEDRISRQRQGRAWRLPRRPLPMNRTLTYLAAAAAVAIVAVAVWQVLPGGPDIGGRPIPSPTASLSLAASPTDDPLWWLFGTTGDCGEAPVAHGCAGPLAAGTYTSGGFKPKVTYTVPAGWVNLRDWGDTSRCFRTRRPIGRPSAVMVRRPRSWSNPSATPSNHAME